MALKHKQSGEPMIAIGRATKLSMGLMLGLFIVSAFGQTPPTATEAFDLRIKCKTMADEKAESLINTRPLTLRRWSLCWDVCGCRRCIEQNQC